MYVEDVEVHDEFWDVNVEAKKGIQWLKLFDVEDAR